MSALPGSKQIEDEIDKASEDNRQKKSAVFDAICSEHLIVRGKLASNEVVENDECARLSDELEDLTWRLIRTPVPEDRHLAYKFEVLRELIGTDWTDGRHRALLESIRNDADVEDDL